MNNAKYVGMSVHKSITLIAVLNELGQFENQSQAKTKAENLCDFFRGIIRSFTRAYIHFKPH